jgi:hypothetical protein
MPDRGFLAPAPDAGLFSHSSEQSQRFYLRRPLDNHFFFQVFNLWTDGSPYSGETW